MLRAFGMREIGPRTFVSEEEIKHLVKEGRQQGVLDQTEMELIHSVFEFTDTPVRKVMVPRPKIFALDADTPPGEVGSLIVESGFSRIPAYEGSLDNVLGVVYVKDVLRLLEKRQPVVIRKILHPVHLVPETKKVGALLKELQKRRSHMALVIDEHGSVTGLVTLEDLIEEIVGEIQDEYDWEERPVERLRDGSLVVEGTLSAAELRDSHDVPLPESASSRPWPASCWPSSARVPKGGEVVQVGDFRFTVVDVEKNRISKVKIEKLPVPPSLTACKRSPAARYWLGGGGFVGRRTDRLDARLVGAERAAWARGPAPAPRTGTARPRRRPGTSAGRARGCRCGGRRAASASSRCRSAAPRPCCGRTAGRRTGCWRGPAAR